MAEQFEREEEKTPVFVINGFLEAGKTQFLRFTMEQSYFQTEGKTLLLVCEEGEEEYPEALLKKYNTAAIYFESQEECTKEALRALGEEFHPERVLIEWNGLWRQDSLDLPEEWFLNQQISIFDTSTLDLYLKNMRAYLGPMLNATELIICNRADEIPEEKLGNYHLSLKAMAPDAEIVFEGKDGEIRGDFSIELPYDLKADKLELTPEMFAIFYIDAMDRPEKYDGKEVSFTSREFDLLAFLAAHPNRVFTKEELFQEIWKMDSIGDIATVTVHIKKLREKIEMSNAVNPQYIETIWGVGYRFKA